MRFIDKIIFWLFVRPLINAALEGMQEGLREGFKPLHDVLDDLDNTLSELRRLKGIPKTNRLTSN